MKTEILLDALRQAPAVKGQQGLADKIIQRKKQEYEQLQKDLDVRFFINSALV